MTAEHDPILLNFPDSFETERLLVRAVRPGDGQAIYEAVADSLEHLRAWMPWALPDPTPEDSEIYARQAAVRWLRREELNFMVIRRADGLLAGQCGLHHIYWDVPCFEMGYWLRANCEGQGYMTEAVRGLTAFCFDHLSAARIEIRMDTLNTRSRLVAERAGYTREGHLHRDRRGTDGALADTYLYAKLRDVE
jgi:RimJ/RimL family protein N-acetyltransferase